MSGVVNKAVEIGSFGLIRDVTGTEEAQRASERAAAQQVGAQREALEYMKEREALPQQAREAALTQLSGAFGLPGFDSVDIMERAKASPLYEAQLEEGQEAVMRQAAMTGGLRSGNVQDALAGQARQALLSSYGQQLSGLQGLAQLPSYAPQIAGGMQGIGQTQAQATMAQGAAKQQDFQNWANMGMMGLGMAFSDRKLKKDIKKIGEYGGHNVYSYAWNKAAEKLGLFGESIGFIADELPKDKVIEKDGFLMVKYGELLGV